MFIRLKSLSILVSVRLRLLLKMDLLSITTDKASVGRRNGEGVYMIIEEYFDFEKFWKEEIISNFQDSNIEDFEIELHDLTAVEAISY